MKEKIFFLKIPPRGEKFDQKFFLFEKVAKYSENDIFGGKTAFGDKKNLITFCPSEYWSLAWVKNITFSNEFDHLP